MQTLEEESKRVLKKQRLCVAQIDRQLDELLSHVETTKQKLEEQQRDLFRRKKIHLGTPSTSEARQGKETRLVTGDDGAAQVSTNEKHSLKGTDASDNYKSPRNDVGVESQENETEYIVRDFIRRVRQLNIEQNVASELKAMHILLSKYSKFIEQNLYTDITKICRAKDFDQKVVCRLVAEYLYQDGQIQAADALCDEARLVLSPTLKECFTELHQMLKAIRKHDMQPALDWARKHRHELKQLDIEIEFELVRLKYVNILEASPDTMDAVCFANTELSYFHQTHAEEVGVLMSCVLYKGKLKESPYKHLFNDNRWDEIYDAVIRACCRLRNVPHRSYLETCLTAGISALPAMSKLVSVMDSKLANWDSMEELPVEIPIAKELRFHSVFSCPISKEESTPGNPPILLKCGHVICRSCVNRISYNMTRRFKCPTCPVEQTERETRKLFF